MKITVGNRIDNFLKKQLAYALLFVLMFLAVFQVVYDIGKPAVKIWDEASSARNAIEMLQNKNYIVVHHNGEPDHWDSKPPLSVWTKVISYKIFGITEFAVRFPTIVSAILTMLVIISFLFFYLKNKWFSVIAIGLIGVTHGYMRYHVARTGDPDTLLLLFVTGYIISFFILLEEYPRKKGLWLILFGSSVVLATYTKSIAGLAPLAGIAVYGLTQKKMHRLLVDYNFHVMWVSVILVIAAYYLIREQLDPGYIREGLFRELSLVSNYPGEPKAPEFNYYFLFLKKKGLRFIFYLIPLAIIPLFLKINNKHKRFIFYAFTGMMVFFLGQSSLLTKNAWYIAPIYPFIWLLLSVSLVHLVSYTVKILNNYNRIAAYAFILLIFVLSVRIYTNLYLIIFEKNQTYKYDTYAPERPGEFYDNVKSKYDIREITIVSNYHPRQMEFYAHKFNYLDSTRTNITDSIHSNIIDSYVIVCEQYFKNKIDSLYDADLITKNEYCRLYFIEGHKE